MPKADYDMLLQFLSICILVFINGGSSSISNAFMEEPWSWGLTVPISLYLKFALELQAHLGICVGVGLPSFVYWGVTRKSIDWYWDKVLEFNIEILKTGCFNLVIGLAHWLVSKLLHHFLEWVKEKKLLSRWSVFSKLEATTLSENPFLRPIAANELFLQLLEVLSVFFYSGNVMLLSWGFSGKKYSSEVGKGISWVSLAGAMFVWMKNCLKVLEMPPEPEEKAYKGVLEMPPEPQEKAYKGAKDQSPIVGSKDQSTTCLSEC